MPERPFRWGILSAANIARRHFVPGVQVSREGRVVAVAARDGERARAFAADLGIPRAYGSYDELLADPEIDGVYVGLPNALHAEWTVKAAAAGKHVLCEKPLSRRAADVEQDGGSLRRRRRDPDGGVHVAPPSPVTPASRSCWRPARSASQSSCGRLLVRDGRRATNAGRPYQRRCWMAASFMDVGCYALNAARFLFDAEPIEVTALQRTDPTLGVDTSFAALARFPGDRLALMEGSFDASGPQRYEIGGHLRLDRGRAGLQTPRTDSPAIVVQSRAATVASSRCPARTSTRRRRTISCGACERAGCCRRPRTAAPRLGRSRRSTAAPRPARPCGSHDTMAARWAAFRCTKRWRGEPLTPSADVNGSGAMQDRRRTHGPAR